MIKMVIAFPIPAMWQSGGAGGMGVQPVEEVVDFILGVGWGRDGKGRGRLHCPLTALCAARLRSQPEACQGRRAV